MRLGEAVVLLMGGLAVVGCAQNRAVEPVKVPPVVADDRAAREHALAGNQAFGAQDYERAVTEYAAAVQAGANTPGVHFRYGYALHVTGHPAEALPHHVAAAGKIENPALKIDAMYNAACACALLGKRDEALSWFGKAIDAGFKDLDQVKQDKDLNSLRGDAEFNRLVESIHAGS
jgi:tetratricopeptide (TPR) repeat protein